MNVLDRIASLPLRLKLGIGLLIAVVLALAISAFAATQYNRAIQPATNLLVQSLAQERASALETSLAHTFKPVEYLSLVLPDRLSSLVANPNNPVIRQEIEATFRGTLNSYPAFRQIRFVAFNGDVLLAVPDIQRLNDLSEDYFRALAGQITPPQTYVSPIRPEVGSGYSLDLVRIPARSGQALGYLVVTVDPANSADPSTPGLFDTLKIVTPSAGVVVFYLVDKNGTVVSPMIQPVTSSAVTVASAKKLGQPPPGIITAYISPVSAAQVTGFIVPVPLVQANLIAEVRTVQLGGSDEAGRFNLQLAIFLAIGALALILIALYLDATIVVPTLSLLKVANNFIQGNPVVVEPLKQQDELGGLYSVFSTLTTQLTQGIRSLEANVNERTRDIEATRDIGRIIFNIHDLDALLQEVVELIRQRFTDIYHAQVFLIDTNEEVAVLRASTGEAGKKLLARGHRLAVGSQSVIGQVTSQGQSVVALDTSTSRVHKANELLPDTRAELALPLRTRSGVIGALDLQSKRAEAFTEADIQLFQSIADQLSIAISNARLFAETQTRLAEIEVLNRQLTGRAWRDYAKMRRQVSLTASTTDENGQWSEYQRRAIETGELVEHLGPDIVTFAVPIDLRGQVIGAIEWDVPRSKYTDHVRQLALGLAARLAIIIENVRSFDQAQRLAQREHLVSDIAGKLTQQTDVAQILQTAVKELGQALHVPQTSIRLATNRDTESLTEDQ